MLRPLTFADEPSTNTSINNHYTIHIHTHQLHNTLKAKHNTKSKTQNTKSKTQSHASKTFFSKKAL